MSQKSRKATGEGTRTRPVIRGAVIIGLTHGTHECFVLCARVSLVRGAGELLVC